MRRQVTRYWHWWLLVGPIAGMLVTRRPVPWLLGMLVILVVFVGWECRCIARETAAQNAAAPPAPAGTYRSADDSYERAARQHIGMPPPGHPEWCTRRLSAGQERLLQHLSETTWPGAEYLGIVNTHRRRS